MKKIIALSLFAIIAAACGNSPQTAEQNQQNNVNVAVEREDNSSMVSSHSQNQTQDAPGAENGTPQTSAPPDGGSPMARAIDVSKMTAAIEKAKTVYEKNPKSEEDKKNLAKAYFERAFALTDAAQYRAALGDFRQGLKLDPKDEAANKMNDEIIRIFKSIGREPPKEGEEPPPMSVKGNETSSSQSNFDERINFANDAISATAAGNLENYDDSETFVIEVKKGQTLQTEQIRDDRSLEVVTVNIIAPDGKPVGDRDASCNSRQTIKPTIDGDYKIRVVECRKADAWKGKFDLKVSVS